jgi:hypothetical protein
VPPKVKEVIACSCFVTPSSNFWSAACLLVRLVVALVVMMISPLVDV